MLDVFQTDAYSMVRLTNAINKMPYTPKRLGQLGIFKEKPVDTTSIAVEEKHGILALIPSAGRSTMPTYDRTPNRKIRRFEVPFFPKNDTVMADEVQNVRAFGSEDELEGVAQKVSEKLAVLRQDHEATHEYHRAGAVRGVMLDADGTTELYNWFTEFGITESEVEFDFSDTDDTMVKRQATTVLRLIETALGADTFDKVHAICGDDFFDELITHPGAKAAFDRWSDGRFFREQQFRTGFEWLGILWENYRGQVGAVKFIPDDVCRFVPGGTTQTFEEIFAPGPYTEAVNTMGKKVYVKQEKMKFDIGIELHTSSSHLAICKRPAVLVKGTMVASS
jgi:hypothetical protein